MPPRMGTRMSDGRRFLHASGLLPMVLAAMPQVPSAARPRDVFMAFSFPRFPLHMAEQ